MRITIDGSPEELSQLAIYLAERGMALRPSNSAEDVQLNPGDRLPAHWTPKDVFRHCKGRKLRFKCWHYDEWFIPRRMREGRRRIDGEDKCGRDDWWRFDIPGDWTVVE